MIYYSHRETNRREHDMNAYEITKKNNPEEVGLLYGFCRFQNQMEGAANYALTALTGAKAHATSEERHILEDEQELIEEWWDTVYEYALDHGDTIATMSATELCAALSE
jgi:hypothetical protein